AEFRLRLASLARRGLRGYQCLPTHFFDCNAFLFDCMEAVTLTAISSIPARLFGRFLGAVAMVTGLAALLPPPDASAATRIEKTFGSWAVICVENDDGTKRCSMVQQRAEQQTRRVVFVWSILSNEGALRQTLTV